MTRGDEVPEWALLAFSERANLDYKVVFARQDGVGLALRSAIKVGGALIAEHEDQPTDPLLPMITDALRETYGGAAPEFVAAFMKAIGERGLKIVEAP